MQNQGVQGKRGYAALSDEKKQGKAGKSRGFASMCTEKKREIASLGGKAAHAKGTAHKWTHEEAVEAGRKGGSISRRRAKLRTH